ncbi:MAG TPA: nucleotidyl transferase AbiEii/AbiGii toxin family protein [Nitrospiraceae bacterium]|nr:nucleotidyl transferase AbiEii/AbiGii toxin family protein [Nitrospiraceae bacterium]
MIGTFTPCLEILPSAQRALWPVLRSASQLGFVLYGETTIVLRLGHRSSVDYDFFTDQPLNRPALYTAFPFLNQATLLQDTPDALTALVPPSAPTDQHVKISFFGMLSFGRVGVPQLTDDGIVKVAAFEDLMATKVKVILQRIEAKDYQDIAAMIRFGITLSHGLAGARALYGPAFQASESLKALVYFEGGDLHRLTQEERTLLIEAASSVRALPSVSVREYAMALPDTG